MARINWRGEEFTAIPIRQIDDNTWLMEAMAHSARFCPGTQILVRTKDIIEMSMAEMPTLGDQGLAAVEAAMLAERATIPSPLELLSKARKDGTLVNPKPSEADHGQQAQASPQAPATPG